MPPGSVQAESQKKSESQSVASVQPQTNSGETAAVLEDNRPENQINLQRQAMIDSGLAQNENQNSSSLEPSDDNVDAEKKINPKSKEHVAKLEEHRQRGASMGEEAQVKFQGELTFAAKFNRLIGSESTYSLLLRKAEEFNKSKNVIDKQLLLKELKPLARTWLEKHPDPQGSGGKEDENEKKKRLSVHKFIEQTTTNYHDLSLEIQNFDSEWKNRLANADIVQEHFTSFSNRYQKLISKLESYRTNYPPSINLLYNEEVSSLNQLLDRVASGSQYRTDISYQNLGFKLIKPKINYSFSNPQFDLEGDVLLTTPDAITSSGKIKVHTQNEKQEIIILKHIDGQFKKGFTTITCNNFSHSTTDGLVSSSVSATVNLYGTDYLLNSSYAKLTEKGLNYETLTGTAEFIDLKDQKTHVLAGNFVFEDGKGLSLDGILELTGRNISMEQGFVNANFDESLQLNQLNFRRAKGRMNFMGQEFILGGLGYELSSKSVIVEYVEKRFEVGDYKVLLSSKKGSVGIDNALDARIFKGKLKGEIDTEKGIAITDPAITHDRGASEAESKTEFDGGLTVKIGDNFAAEGKVKATFAKNEVESISIQKGAVYGTYQGITLTMTDLSYKTEGEGIIAAKSVHASINAFDKTIILLFTKARISEKGFDFDSISAKLDAVDFGLLEVTNPTLTYSTDTSAFHAKLDYSLKKSRLPDVLKDSTVNAKGGLEVKWDPNSEANRFYKIKKTDASLKLLGQTLAVKEANYDSTTKEFDTKEATLKMDLGIFKDKVLKGEKISFSQEKGFSFSKMQLKHEQDLDFGAVTLSSKDLILNKDDKGFKVQANGLAKLNLPEVFKADTNAEFEGFIALYLPELTPSFKITKGKADIEVANPLVELAKFLGDGWSKTRFELGASIPVFPGIAAVFGVYIQLLAQMPEKIKGSAKLENEMLILALKLKSKLEVEGGVFGGVQGGSQLLVALAVLLRAAAKMGIDLSVGYKKNLQVKEGAEKPDKELKKDDGGFTYALTGELKAGAYLDLVATALYFFQKTFTLELKEWTLGDFEFSNKKTDLPKGGEGSKFKEEDLRKEVTPEALKDAEVAKMNADELLNQKQNERFSAAQKKEILEKIKKGEEGRATVFAAGKQKKEEKKKSGELDSGGESLFDDVAAMNMQFMDKYIDKTVEWKAVLDSMKNLGQIQESDPTKERKNEIKNTLMTLSKIITIPGDFKDHYIKLTKDFETKYSESNSASKKAYVEYIKNKADVLGEVHKFKHDSLHSGFWGDESQIDSTLSTSSFFTDSNFIKFAKFYNALSKKIVDNSEKLKIGKSADSEKLISDTLKEMHEEHQKELEKQKSTVK